MNKIADRITINTAIGFQDPLPDETDIVIIGGGVIGVFAALYLARRGKRVFLCEKGRIAGEQSSRNWGWIRQHGRDEAELAIMMQSLDLWHQVNAQTNGACGVVTTGVSYLASSENEMAKLERWLPIARDHGLKSELLSRKQVSDSFSGKSNSQWVGAVATPSDAKGEPWQAVPAVARLAHDEGAKLRENCAVRALDIAAGKISGVITEAGRIKCAQVILAGGAWSSLFARAHGVSLPQLAVRSTVAQSQPMPAFATSNSADEELALRRRDDDGYSLAICDSHDSYLGPDAFRHARVFLPAMRESWRHINILPFAPGGFPDGWSTPRQWSPESSTPFEKIRVLEPAVNKRSLKKIIERFSKRFPGIGAPVIKNCWAGMIDAMPDIVPVVDRVPEIPGLIVATGMSGHGFGIGPGFAKVITRLTLGDAAEHDLRRFRIGRFKDGDRPVLGPSL